MKVLVIDQYCALLSMCMRAQDDGHEVLWWLPQTAYGNACKTGDGFVKKVKTWEQQVKWADLIITATNQKYMRNISPLFARGLPVFGCNPMAAELELDRGLGQTVCSDYGIDTLPYEVFSSYSDAMKYVEKTMGVYVSKPWGGAADKALSYVSRSPEDLIYKLSKWEEGGKLKGQIMLQKRVKGIEIAVGGWFGKSGWSKYLCENFEEKKFMNEGLGQNTGEQGTVIRYTEKSKLFDETLEPVTGYLHKIGYVGYVDMNTMVQDTGKAWPLEFTMRFGYPIRDIQNSLHLGDSITWMADLLEGRDTLKVSNDIAVGVVLSHGEYPNEHHDDPRDDGIPIYGVMPSMEGKVHYLDARCGTAPVRVGDKIKNIVMPVTTGPYIATVVGTGKTVSEAQESAYAVAWKIKPPTNLMFRTDIGCRLEEQLPVLQSNGYAEGIKY